MLGQTSPWWMLNILHDPKYPIPRIVVLEYTKVMQDLLVSTVVG